MTSAERERAESGESRERERKERERKERERREKEQRESGERAERERRECGERAEMERGDSGDRGVSDARCRAQQHTSGQNGSCNASPTLVTTQGVSCLLPTIEPLTMAAALFDCDTRTARACQSVGLVRAALG